MALTAKWSHPNKKVGPCDLYSLLVSSVDILFMLCAHARKDKNAKPIVK
jgi:hypothetical protein